MARSSRTLLKAIAEIDRLLYEANNEFYDDPCTSIGVPEPDLNETLVAGKEKFLSEQLLKLFKSKMCSCCGTKLRVGINC